MACGTTFNTYHTLASAVIVLADGTMLDTAASSAEEQLKSTNPDIYYGLSRLRDRVRGNANSTKTISRLFSIKNTMGYSLNAFLDYTTPVDLLKHLVIGSEGTLAFVAGATFDTVPVHAHVATGLLVFNDLASATGILPELVASGFSTIELLDASSLKVAQRDPMAERWLQALPVRDHAALLVEFQQPTAQLLAELIESSRELLSELPLASGSPWELSTDLALRKRLWQIRKGLYTAVAGNRPAGTTALLEDVAVPVERLLPTCIALTALFDEHGYEHSVIFGHAKDGNVHFMLNERFDSAASLDRYVRFTDEMVDLVLAEGGTLKAEHGTGRIMAPYLERQYGRELFDVMHEIKSLIDPRGVLNPGVLLNKDPKSHTQHLKTSIAIEREVDRCVECGYCEPACPSRDLTLTPRQRIVLRREMAKAESSGDNELLRQLRAEYKYDGIQTCAVDGMCQSACPVLIDTGELVRHLRSESRGKTENAIWTSAARHWDMTTRAAGAALSAAQLLPSSLPSVLTRAARRLGGDDQIPLWSGDLPAGGRRRQPKESPQSVAVYFPSCLRTIFGSGGGLGAHDAFLALCARADLPIRIPPGIPSFCCGTPWKSKGLVPGFEAMAAKVAPALWRATEQGALPIVTDSTSCTQGLLDLLRSREDGERLRVIDAVEFADAVLLPRLTMSTRLTSLAVHPTCASTHLGINDTVFRLASAVAKHVYVAASWGCCGFAGDRGMLHPELTASATTVEASTLNRGEFSAYASSNRTCEIGMARATGRDFRHILELVELATRSDSADA